MNITRSIIALAVALGLCGLASAQEGKLKIATVDMQQLFKEYHKTAEAQKEVNVERQIINKENQERLEVIRSLDDELQKMKKLLDDPSVADSKKSTVHRDYQMKQNEGIALDRERREFLQRRNQSLNEKMLQRMKEILDEIRKMVEVEATKENYDYVFDKSGLSTSQVPFLLFAKDATDITAVLLGDLNKNAPASTDDGAAEGGDQ